jgi:hypothetical protein
MDRKRHAGHTKERLCGYKLANDRHRHPRHSGLARACVDHTHHQIHGIELDAIQGLLAGLSPLT